MVNIRASCATMTHIFNVAEGKKFTNTWIPHGKLGADGLRGDRMWTDGDNIYFSDYGNNLGDPDVYLKLNKETMTWETMTWNFEGNDGLAKSAYGNWIWSDGTDIYETFKWKLNKETDTWEAVTFNNAPEFYESCIWTDGDNVYYSRSTNQYKLNKGTMTWETVTWEGRSSFSASYIWTDGTDIYFSDGTISDGQYKLIKGTNTWEKVKWNARDPMGNSIWSDGTNIYYSSGYKLNKETMTWEDVTWNGWFDYGQIWGDGTNIYFSQSDKTYILLPDTANLYMRDGTSWKKVVSLGDG